MLYWLWVSFQLTESSLERFHKSNGERLPDRDWFKVFGYFHMPPPHQVLIIDSLNVVPYLDNLAPVNDWAFLNPFNESISIPIVRDGETESFLCFGDFHFLLCP